MKELLDHLRDQTRTLTIYDYDGPEDRLATLRTHLSGYGVALRTVSTDEATPSNVAVFHRGEEVVGTVDLDALLPADSIEAAFGSGDGFDPEALPFDVDADVTVSPETGHGRMVGISRRFEKEALSHGDGWMRTGFQELSVLAGSPRTRSVYRRLSAAGIDVAACAYPDVELDDPGFEVIDDPEGQFRDYWFLLFDGGHPDHKAALVAKHRNPAIYDAFWTVDPGTVDDLIGMARDRYPALA